MDLLLNDTTFDLEIVDGGLALTESVEAVRQYLRSKLKTVRGEWFLDLTAGVPYYEEVFKKGPDPVVIDAVFKEAILTTPGVLELLEFDMDLDGLTRKLTLQFKIRTLEGVIIFSEEVP